MAFRDCWDNLALEATLLVVIRMGIQAGNFNLPLQVAERFLEISHNQARVEQVNHHKVLEVEVQVRHLKVQVVVMVVAVVACLTLAILAC